MSVISAGTLSELLEAFPEARVKVNGDVDITIEFEVNPDGKIAFNVKRKTAESEAQSGQDQ